MTALAIAHQADALASLLEDITGTDEILAPMRSMGSLLAAARRSEPAAALSLLDPLAHDHQQDPLAAYLSVHAMAEIASPSVDATFLCLLSAGDSALSRQVAWAWSRRRPFPPAIPALEEMIDDGGVSKMMAELTLESWIGEIPEMVWRLRPDIGHRMIEVTANRAEAGDAHPQKGSGLRIAQILIQGRVDPELTAAGSGDGGGLITLQVGLTRELSRHAGVDEVFLVTRLIEDESEPFDKRYQPLGNGTLARIPFGGPGYAPVPDLWAHRLELEAELRRFLVVHGPFDALHLRFADVGTFAAARVAEELGIPVFFTLAPDPHGVIAAAEASGELTRSNFASADRDQHLFLRAWLVEYLLRRSDRLALLPRKSQRAQFERLFGVDTAEPRFSVIPEGVDFSRAVEASRAIEQMRSTTGASGVIAELDRAVAGLPPERRDLPLMLSVGRLHRVKGMGRVVAAWANDPDIRTRFNLVIVGGDLNHPSQEESRTLAEIARALETTGPEGLLMLGSRTHQEVALLMAAAVAGTPGGVSPNGIYVAGSEKEEFGLAIVEAMAAGLPVVAPRSGGPATYVDDLFTGFLADTKSVASLREGIRWADRVRHSEVRADFARRKIKTGYSLEAMAEELVHLYKPKRAEPTAS